MAVTMVSDTIGTRFERQAAATPDNLAVVTDELSLTYRELDAVASRIAGSLAVLPWDNDRPVALLMSEGPFLYAAILGAAKAGRVFFVLPVTSPEPWLSALVADSAAAHILTDNSWCAVAVRVAGTEANVLEVDRIAASTAPIMADPALWPNAPACIAYTSGSTGRPKGVLLTHRGLLHRHDLQAELLGLQQADRVANLWPTSTSAGLGNTLAPLCAGACVLPFDIHSRGLHSLTPWIAARKITGLSFACSLFRTWLAVLPDGCRLPSLRYVRLGGDPLYGVDVARAAQHLGSDWRICYVLSSTECATMAGLTLNSSSQLGQGAVPVGFPVRGTEIRLENDAGQIVGPGEIGEVVVKSPFLAHGYWKEPELTASSFLTDPADGRRFFRTGDLGRWRSDGTLEHFGRKGRKIKVRGFSIEPYEVECELLRQPGISNAVVVLHQDAGKEALLVAYVAAPSNISASTIRNGLATRLPTHMVPSHIVVMDSLPMTAGGKIDRRALPLPSSKNLPLQGYRAATNEHPRDALEEVVAGVWRDVLKLEQVGVHDNFFELGGHSLLAMQVVARLAKLLKLNLSLQRFFQIATVSALAAELQEKLGTDEARASPPLVSVPRTGKLPLSFAQQRLWFLDRLLPNKATYNIPALWRLRGQLDAPALERSLNEVVARHEALRTRFVLGGDEPVQVIEPPSAVTVPVVDLSAMPPAEREARARQLTDSDACQPFDLETGPLLRAQLLRLAAEEHLLLLSVHHIAFDGWSMGVLWRELSSAYSALVSGQRPDLPRLPVQYADYAVWQRACLQGEALEQQLAYWKEKLADLSTLELPTDRPRPSVPSNQGAHFAVDLLAPLTQALKELSRREGTTLFMTLLAAFQVLLHRYSGQEDIAVGTPIAGRRRTELEGLIGFFVNTLVLHSDLAGKPTFTEFLARVRDSALGAYTHQDIPFEMLVAELSPSRDTSRHPLFQVMFVLQNAPDAAPALQGVQASRLPLAGHSAKFDLTLMLRETVAGLHARWEYSTDLFDAATVERMAQHFKTLLEGVVADADQRNR